jgi:transposase
VAEIAFHLEIGCKIEIWFQDEARVGQKTKRSRRWAERGTRPAGTVDQRTCSAWIFGAICPEYGKGAAIVMPWCNTQAMKLHLEEISRVVAPDAHGIVLCDQAGWHMSEKLNIPNNISLLPIPPRSPELNSQENIWQYIRDNWLNDVIFKSYDHIVEHCCCAWRKLIKQPETIRSIGMREWAHAY